MSDIHTCQYGHTPDHTPTMHGEQGYCKECLEYDFVAETQGINASQGVVVRPARWIPSLASEIEARKRLAGMLPAAPAPQPVPTVTPSVEAPRLTFDRDTFTVTLDGEPYPLDPTAFLLYKAIFEVEQPPISGDDIRIKVKGLNGSKAVTNRIDSLPDALRQTVQSGGGRGYWVVLPPAKKVPK